MRKILTLLFAVVLSACASTTATSPAAMNDASERYVKLVLALGQHDADYVDAYYGPPEWKNEAAGSKMALDEIGTRAKALLADLAGQRGTATQKAASNEEMTELRHHYLERQLS